MKEFLLLGAVMAILITGCSAQPVLQVESSIAVPQGHPPTLDGVISSDEWVDSKVEIFSDGSELLLMHDEAYLYLGIRTYTSDMFVGNIFVDHGDEVVIMHSSAALGTAIYSKGVETWERTQDFTWRCRSTSNNASAKADREEFLKEDGWLANISYMGSPNEMEYQIALPQEALRLAVALIPTNDLNTRIYWPTDLEDDCIDPTSGGMPSSLYFSPENWAVLETSK